VKLKFSDLWRWDGTVDRGHYLFYGLILFAVKHNIDRFVATLFFGRPWSPISYLQPKETLGSHVVQHSDMTFYTVMLLLSLPFIWTGAVLTLRRLRATQLPPWLLVLFFVPVVNLLFFIIMAVLPSRDADQPYESPPDGQLKACLDKIIPRDALGSATMSMLIMILLGTGAAALSIGFMKTYGVMLFVGLPFCLGFGSVLLYSYHGRRSFLYCLFVSWICVGLMGAALVAFAIEGVICLLMALPLALGLATMGAILGYLLQRHYWDKNNTLNILLALFVSLPLLMGAESRTHGEPPVYAVKTHLEINAPPQAVWQEVVGFSEIPAPDEFFFRMGIAYPIRAEVHGRGPGAIRHCIFSTGPFVEPITVWDEPHQLKFSVTGQPPAMKEWSPYKDLSAPHIDHYLISNGGQFLLTPLPGGRTRLEGTTWYYHKIWPSEYWHYWSDALIHRIHMRVLSHIKQVVEDKTEG
jgi:uncharacterized membrane protein YhaH (DUF805 family)